ncbi:MAG TPA: ATP-dependent RNA helicase [Sphaerochaeta sp.]|nr:ATP-dependent RNA helicase [Sphaerochaeta sp.]
MKDFTQLPVYQRRQDILDALSEHQVIIVESPTGSGKTTQIPLILHEAGYGNTGVIGVTQPRRIATLSVSEFIAKQIKDTQGLVGYKMRFEDTTVPATQIKVMTDGILLMELKADPLLSAYSVMLIDEAHERSLNIDFILGLLKHVIAERPDFKVIISSATINTKVFSRFYDGAPIININARIFPVRVHYRPIGRATLENQVFEIVKIVKAEAKKKSGDILIFMTGEFDITVTVNNLIAADPRGELEIYPLFGRLSKEEQEAVFTPTKEGKTKVVVATNIAETSITIDGITTVIDSGVAKVNFYNQKDFTSSLVPLPISRSSCEQRKGRAGRTAPGQCYRLYSKEDYQSRSPYGTEEILRTDLSEVVMRMSDLGIYDYEKFPFITRPRNSSIISAEETLRFIGAIDTERRLTQIGTLMSRFPLLPRHARVIVEAMMGHPDVLVEVIIAISFLSTKTPYLLVAGEEEAARAAHRRLNTSAHGDFVTYLQIFKQYTANKSKEAKQRYCTRNYLDYQGMQEIVNVHEQLGEICGDIGFPLTSGGSVREYLSCIASGLLQYVCVRSKGNMYKSLTADMIYIHPGSTYFKSLPKFIIAGEIMQTSRLYARSVSPLEREWLNDISEGLSEQLTALSRPASRQSAQERKREERARKDRRAAAERKGAVQVYGKRYDTEEERRGKKRSRRVAIIPLEDLNHLYKTHQRAAQRPKNFPAALLWRGMYIHYGDTFSSIIELHGKLRPDRGILDHPPSGVFSLEDGNRLFDNLDWILAFCRNKRDRKHLFFITLVESGGNYRFVATKDCYDALDTSLYTLMHLSDDLANSGDTTLARRVAQVHSRLLKLID